MLGESNKAIPSSKFPKNLVPNPRQGEAGQNQRRAHQGVSDESPQSVEMFETVDTEGGYTRTCRGRCYVLLEGQEVVNTD